MASSGNDRSFSLMAPTVSVAVGMPALFSSGLTSNESTELRRPANLVLDKSQETCDTTATEASERKTLLAGNEADRLQLSTLTTEEWKAEQHSNWNVSLSKRDTQQRCICTSYQFLSIRTGSFGTLSTTIICDYNSHVFRTCAMIATYHAFSPGLFERG